MTLGVSLNPSGPQFLLEHIWHNSTARRRGCDESVCSLPAKDMLGQGTGCVLVSVGRVSCACHWLLPPNIADKKCRRGGGVSAWTVLRRVREPGGQRGACFRAWLTWIQ